MLKPDQFFTGTLAQAAPLSLVLPRNQYEKPFIVGTGDGKPIAVCLEREGDFTFGYFFSENATNWRGLIIPDIAIEVDETSLYDPSYNSARLGSLVRSETRLGIAAKPEGGWRGGHTLIPLVEGLPAVPDDASAGFTRWQIVIGDGTEKRVLKTMSVEPAA